MKKKEIIIILAIAMLAFIAIVLMNYFNSDSVNKYVTITVDNKIYEKTPLDENTNETFDIHTHLGSNTIVIEDGIVKVVDANCPDLVCVKTKPASNTGDMIVCLPHKLIVEITNE